MTADAPKNRFFDKVFVRRRKRSSSANDDPDFVLSGHHRDQMQKHRSCVVHLVTYTHGQVVTRKQARKIQEEYATRTNSDLESFPATNTSSDPVPFQAAGTSSDPILSEEVERNFNPVPIQSTNVPSVPIIAPDMSSSPVPFQETNTTSSLIPSQAINMSSYRFGDHLERIWRSFPADEVVQFTYLDCLWFGMYRDTSRRTKVLSWIKKKNIFSRNYVFVPICCWSHWNLLILCHFSENFGSENKRPCMLLLDSLHMADPTRLERDIRKFVLDIYKEKGISDQRVSKIPLLIPKVPQQTNKECGFFSLYFIKKFMEDGPETITAVDISFMDKNWFTREELNGFCIQLEESKAEREVEAIASEEMVHESRDGDVIHIHD